MFVACAILLLAAIVVLLAKRPVAGGVYLYSIVVGLLLSCGFLLSYTETMDERVHCLLLGAGVGAVLGLVPTVIFCLLGPDFSASMLIGWIVLLPFIELILGAILVFLLGIYAWFGGVGIAATGIGTAVLVCSCIGGGGTILLVIIDR